MLLSCHSLRSSQTRPDTDIDTREPQPRQDNMQIPAAAPRSYSGCPAGLCLFFAPRLLANRTHHPVDNSLAVAGIRGPADSSSGRAGNELLSDSLLCWLTGAHKSTTNSSQPHTARVRIAAKKHLLEDAKWISTQTPTGRLPKHCLVAPLSACPVEIPSLGVCCASLSPLSESESLPRSILAIRAIDFQATQ